MWFVQHYGPETYNKNWIYKADNHLYASRWEILIAQRNRIAIAEVSSGHICTVNLVDGAPVEP